MTRPNAPITTGSDVSSSEDNRLRALRSYDVLDSPEEAVFDEFARLAASIAGTPIALVSFVDAQRQWSKSKVGVSVSETDRQVAFCAKAIESADVYVVRDALEDGRFADNPLVAADPKVRYYAGAPLVTAEGYILGTLCVMDVIPRELSPEQQSALQILSRHVMAQLDLRRRLADFARGDAPRRKTVAALRRALASNEFVLHYQPKVNIRSGRLTGLEALIRWKPPGKALVPPADFIHLLEESDLILDVGAWVILQAMADHRDMTAQGLDVPPIAVNVSPHQLRHPDFIGQLEYVLGSEGAARAPLDIEITEGVLLEKTEEIINTLACIRSLGIQVAIDDFGTGYSSLRYLAHLPIDTLKIDQSFVAVMTEDADDMAIVSSIIALAHGLDLKVVAEGVETEEQRKLLQLLRCDAMQGFLYSAAVPKHKLEDMLRAESQVVTQRSLPVLDPTEPEYSERRFARKRSKV